jgi:hypothetical protein
MSLVDDREITKLSMSMPHFYRLGAQASRRAPHGPCDDSQLVALGAELIAR